MVIGWKSEVIGTISCLRRESSRTMHYPGGLVLILPDYAFGAWAGTVPLLKFHSKFTTFYKNRFDQPWTKDRIGVNYNGNHKKSLKHSLDDSLKKLKTDYIDLLYVHWWDHSTSIPELMQSLGEVVRSGKVLYLGVSDTPGE